MNLGGDGLMVRIWGGKITSHTANLQGINNGPLYVVVPCLYFSPWTMIPVIAMVICFS